MTTFKRGAFVSAGRTAGTADLAAGNAVALAAQELLACDPEHYTQAMLAIAEGVASAYGLRVEAELSQFGRPVILDADGEPGSAAQQCLNKIFLAAKQAGIVLPGSRDRKVDKRKASLVQRMLAELMKRLNWEEYAQVHAEMGRTLEAAKKRGEC
jgi:hypothetical protein